VTADLVPNRDRIPIHDRIAALATVATAAAAVLAFSRVVPDPRGHGTHEQLGLAPCSWPLDHGMPCPTCGVTTAAAHVVQLSPLRALATQPFGALLALSGLVLGAFALACLVRRRPFVEPLVRLPYGTLLTAAIVAFLASWLYTACTWEIRPGA
jgi:hypothetical protein